ncbi:hypothetical protein HOLleu_00577 [Holothuria leucospilota]|uniref:Uncharacterized protein n=1 Tax=Holothuria leucospilota TaxID=206669 RepID=A0A9Q1HJS1_HOLLE|nr:hypothetical protein HOLleu_00577 [Holothuria leucospilota]
MNFQNFLPILFMATVVLTVPGGTDALKCYVCNSTTECQTTFDPTEHRLEECDGYCYKTTMEDMSGEMMFVRRGCEPSDIDRCPSKCLESGSRQCNICCETDKCNSANILSTCATMPLLILVWSLTYRP